MIDLSKSSWGYEIEWGDIDRRIKIPENLGSWEYAETDIVNLKEPFKGLFTQGMVCHETYKDNENNQILINKGWIPLSSTLDDVGNESNETYIGILLEYDIKPSIGQDDIKNSDYLFRIEKDFLSNEINAELPPLYLQLTENCGENIICINNDENSDPPHLGYAFQWVFFALCLSLVILRKNKLI